MHMAATTEKKKNKIQRKKALRYPKVTFTLDEILDGEIVVPGTEYLPNAVALAIETGRFSVLVTFLRENDFEDAAEAFEMLQGKDETMEFFQTWGRASKADLPKSSS